MTSLTCLLGRRSLRCGLVLVLALAAAPCLASAATTAYSIGNPTADEQFMLELINRARANPPAEGQRLAAISDTRISQVMSFYNVDRATLAQQFSTYAARPPLAFSAALIQSSRAHSSDMATNNFQDHTGSNGSTLLTRVQAAGVANFNSLGENIYAYSESVYFGYAGLNVDWGVSSLGHRSNIMNFDTTPAASYTEVGVGIVSESNPNTQVGPLVITQDFMSSSTHFITGVAYRDANGDGLYTPGEGLAGVTISPSVGTYYAVTSSSGGYAIPITTTGSVTLTASGGGLSANLVQTVTAGSVNVKADFIPGTTSTGGGTTGGGGSTTTGGPTVAQQNYLAAVYCWDHQIYYYFYYYWGEYLFASLTEQGQPQQAAYQRAKMTALVYYYYLTSVGRTSDAVTYFHALDDQAEALPH